MMKTPPPEVLAAARVIERWAAENNIQSWKIGARVQTERWRGPVMTTVYGDDFDRVVDSIRL